MSKPTCVFCGRSGSGVQFNIFTPRFQPFGTACVECEEQLPPGTVVPARPVVKLDLTKPPKRRAGVVRPAQGGMQNAEGGMKTPTPTAPTPTAPEPSPIPHSAFPTPHSAAQAVLQPLAGWIGNSQRAALLSVLCGEEGAYMADKLRALAERIAAMPETYEQDGKGQEAIAYLHYFAGGQASWWITEKDKGAPDDTPADFQRQAFGLADLFQDGGELGYISIPEILANGGELDLYFAPTPLSQCGVRNAECGMKTPPAPPPTATEPSPSPHSAFPTPHSDIPPSALLIPHSDVPLPPRRAEAAPAPAPVAPPVPEPTPTPTPMNPNTPTPAAPVVRTASANSTAVVIELDRGKECKGSVRFETPLETAAVTNIYLSRIVPQAATAKRVRLTVEFV